MSKKTKMRTLAGVQLWSVSIKNLSCTLWITGPMSGVTKKAMRVMRHDFPEHKRPRIYRIQSHGTIDA